MIVGIPGQSVADFARDHADELAGKVVIDASNKFGDGPAHSAAEFAVLAPAARYARAFNALGWENFADPSSTASWPTSSTLPTRPTATPSNASSATSASTPSTSAPASTTCSTSSSSSGSPLQTARAAQAPGLQGPLTDLWGGCQVVVVRQFGPAGRPDRRMR